MVPRNRKRNNMEGTTKNDATRKITKCGWREREITDNRDIYFGGSYLVLIVNRTKYCREKQGNI